MNIAANPTDAIAQLYASHHAWLHAWLRRKLGCSHGAADLAQDVFVRILASRDALCGMREPRAAVEYPVHPAGTPCLELNQRKQG